MKRSKFALVLTGLAVAALCGCESRGFRAERDMYRAQKKARVVFSNPKGTPPLELQQAVDAFKAVITKYPDSTFAIQSKFGIGYLYQAVGDYDRARAEFSKMTVNCTSPGNLCAEATFAIGRSYELEKRWPEALEKYKHIMEAFPYSSKGLETPLYIVGRDRVAKDMEAARRAVDEAVAFYLNLKAKAKTEKVQFMLQGLVSRAYVEGAQWQDALDSLDKLMRDYPKFNPEGTLFIKAMIYGNQLKDKEKAKQALQKIVTDYPRTRLAKEAELLLKKL